MERRTSQLIRRRVTPFFEFGLPSPPWMAYSFCKEFLGFNMNNATSTVLLLAIPLAIMTVVQFGWLRSTAFYLIAGGLLSLAVAVLIIAAIGASAMAAGHGSGESGGWEGSYPLILHGILSGILLILGAIARPERNRQTSESVTPAALKTLREVKESNKKKQNKAEMATPRKPYD